MTANFIGPRIKALREYRQLSQNKLARMFGFKDRQTVSAIRRDDLWDRVHNIMQESPRKRANNSRSQTPALLKGLIFSDTGAAMTPTSTKKGAKLYRYYVSMDVIRNRETGEETAPMRLTAGMVEDAVVTEVRRILHTP